MVQEYCVVRMMFVLCHSNFDFVKLWSEQLTNVPCKRLSNRLTYSCCFIQIMRLLLSSSLRTMIVLSSSVTIIENNLQRWFAGFSLWIHIELWTLTVSIRTRLFPSLPLYSNFYLAVIVLSSWTMLKTLMKYRLYNRARRRDQIACLPLLNEHSLRNRGHCWNRIAGLSFRVKYSPKNYSHYWNQTAYLLLQLRYSPYSCSRRRNRAAYLPLQVRVKTKEMRNGTSSVIQEIRYSNKRCP